MRVLVLLGVLSSLTAQSSVIGAQPTPRQYDALWQQPSSSFRGWTLQGVTVSGTPLAARIASTGGAIPCSRADIDGGRARYHTAAGLCAGTDPGQPGKHGAPDYTGHAFVYGVLRSPVHRTPLIDHIIVSWDATTPAGTWLEPHVRVLESGTWTHWYDLPVWASGDSAIHRHSIDGQHDRWGGVATDTFYTAAGHPSAAYQVAVTLFATRRGISPALRSVAVIASRDTGALPAPTPDRAAWGIDLPVPARSQMPASYRSLGYGGGGEAWCSPTSTDMVMAYWARVTHRPALDLPVPTVAAGTYDATYDGTGNWPFNTAFAGEYGLIAYVTRFYSLRQVERWVQARVPIVISVAFGPGELPGAPIPSTDGHLMVVRGFTKSGDPIVNDPAAPNDKRVRMVYPRAALQRVWQRGSHGTAYVMYPAGSVLNAP